MYIKNKRGQSTVEYVLLVTAVVAVIIALVSTNNGGFQTQLNTTIGTATNDMSSLSGTLADSHAATNATAGTPAPYTVNVTP